MPKIAVYKFLTFFIYSFDVLHEPPHLHIVKEKGMKQRSAKIWLHTLEIAAQGSLSDKELKLALNIIKLHREAFLDSIKKIRSGKSVKRMTIN